MLETLTRPCVQLRHARPPSPNGWAQGLWAQMETCGQSACSAGTPARSGLGEGGRFVVSPMMTEYASAADSAPDLLHWADHGFDEGDFFIVQPVFFVELLVNFGDGFCPIDV